MKHIDLNRTVSAFSAILLVISAIIGSGVFKKIAPMADSLHSSNYILFCWAVAGIISLAGALCNAELASMMPASGGEYVYLNRIYGRFFSFLYGWANLTVMKSCTIAALAYVFAESLNVLVPLPESDYSIRLVATLLIVVLSYVNHRGLAFGEKLSRFLILGIIAAIIIFIFAAFLSSSGTVRNLSIDTKDVPDGQDLTLALFASLLSAFWGYEGWNNIAYIGDEVKNPQRNIPLALGLGTIAVIVIYLLLNAAYLYVMPLDQLAAVHHAESKIAAVEVSRLISGNAGAMILSALILFATFNCVNSTILMSARIFFAMAKDGMFLKNAANVHPKFKTPSKAIMWQGIWAILLLWSGNFDQLTDLLIFAAFIFYGATAFGVILLRRKDPHAARPYKVIGYPALPLLFALFCFTLVVVTIYREPVRSLGGLALILAGTPLYYYFIRKKKTSFHN